jgi:transposase
MEPGVVHQVRQLYEVERLSLRQIAYKLAIARKTISRIIKAESLKRPARDSLCKPYERLIREWYHDYPFLKATQVYDRLKSFGFLGGYGTVKRYTHSLRHKQAPAFHELEFLPGEESQVDWMEWRFPFGLVYGFVLILAYSRYLYVQLYPRHSLEFFLEGHIEAFREMRGVAHRHRYDNLKSVVLKRTPELTLNPQFLDFARHYGFSIHPCTPGRANEKGRVERVIRDIKDFLKITPCRDIFEANRKLYFWRQERNQRPHRSTNQEPLDLLKEEKLIALPQIPYKTYRLIFAQIRKTGFIEFDTNRYSVPSSLSGGSCEIFAYPRHLEIWFHGKKVATHPRSFERNQKIEHPGHREQLLNRTPQFKLQRIFQLLNRLDPSVTRFLQEAQAGGQDPLPTAHQLFQLLIRSSKARFLAAIREANSLKIGKISYIQSLLQPRPSRPDFPPRPQDPQLLTITYAGRSLDDYDDLV